MKQIATPSISRFLDLVGRFGRTIKKALSTVILLTGFFSLSYGMDEPSEQNPNLPEPTANGKYTLIVVPDSLYNNLDSTFVALAIVALDASGDSTYSVNDTVSLGDTTYFKYVGYVVMDTTDSINTVRFGYRLIYTGYSPVSGAVTLFYAHIYYHNTLLWTCTSVQSVCVPYNTCPSRFDLAGWKGIFNVAPLNLSGYAGISYAAMGSYQQQVTATILDWYLINATPIVSDYINVLDTASQFEATVPNDFCETSVNSCICLQELFDSIVSMDSVIARVPVFDTASLDPVFYQEESNFLFHCFCNTTYFLYLYGFSSDSTTGGDSLNACSTLLFPSNAEMPVIETYVISIGGHMYSTIGYSYNFSAGTGIIYLGGGSFAYGGDMHHYRPDSAVILNNDTLHASGPIPFCKGDSVILSLGTMDSNGVLWSTGDTTLSLHADTAGNYFVTQTSPFGCIERLDTIISYFPVMQLTDTPNVWYCALGSLGSISIGVSGGTPPFRYLWSNSDTTRTVQNLAAGIYRVTVTDSTGCTDTLSATLNCIPFCGIDSLTISCDHILPIEGFWYNIWTVNYDYSGSSGSTFFATTAHSFLGATISNPVVNGYNSGLVLTGWYAGPPYPYDTVTVSVIDSLTGDTCSLPVYVSLAFDTTLFYHTCDSSVSTFSAVTSVSCLGIDPFDGLPEYMVTIPYYNNSGVGRAEGVMCLDCGNEEDNAAWRNPGASIDTIYFEPDSLTQDSAHLTIIDIESDWCTDCANNITIPIPALGTPVFASDDTVLCAGTTSCYTVTAANSASITYSVITTGGETIDTSGCVSGVDSNFTVTVIIQGVLSCEIDTLFRNVRVNPLPANITPVALPDTTCYLSSVSIFLNASEAQSRYDLRIDSFVVASVFGNGDSISVNTGALEATTVFNILAVDTNTLCSRQLTPSDTINLSGLGIPVFVAGESNLCQGSTSCYSATARNSVSMKYSIVYGTALTNPYSGCVSNVDSNFVIRATAYNALGCDSTFTDLEVPVHKPAVPDPIPTQVACNDSPVVFNFDSIEPGYWGNQIEWATNPSFISSHIITSPINISLTVAPGADSLIWIRTKDSVTGCVSDPIHTNASVNILPPSFSPVLLEPGVCPGSSTTVRISGSSIGVRYFLRIDTFTVSNVLGNGDTIYLPTGAIDTPTTFNVLAINELTNCYSIVNGLRDTLLARPDTPTLIAGDTFLCRADTMCYSASSLYSSYLWFSIIDGDAFIDSASGCVTGVESNFVLRISAISTAGCIVSKNINVREHQIAPPNNPAARTICSDTPVNVIFDTIWSGSGGNQVEWAYTADFDETHTSNSPAVLSLELYPFSAPTVIWLRSRDSVSGCTSDVGSTSLWVSPYPNPIVSPQDTTVGLGDTVVLTASGGTSYYWPQLFSDSPSLMIVPTWDSSTYTVEVSNGAGCIRNSEARIEAPAPNAGEMIVWIAGATPVDACDEVTFSGTLKYDAPVFPPGCTGNFSFHIDADTHLVFAPDFSFVSATVPSIPAGQSYTITGVGNTQLNFQFIHLPSGTYNFSYTLQLACGPAIPLSAPYVGPGLHRDYIVQNITSGFHADDCGNPEQSSINNSTTNPVQIQTTLLYPDIVATPFTAAGQTIPISPNTPTAITSEYYNLGTLDYSGALYLNGSFCSNVNVTNVDIYIDGVYQTSYGSPSWPLDLLSAGVLTIPKGESLKVVETVEWINCDVSPCNANFRLSYGCPADTCRETANAFITLDFKTRPYVVVSRIAPSPGGGTNPGQYVWDNSCMGTETPWQFLIINRSGNNNQDGDAATSVTIDLSDAPYTGSYEQIDDNSFTLHTTGNDERFNTGSATLPIVSYTITKTYLTPSGCVASPIAIYQIVVPSLPSGQNVILSFSTYRCCPSGGAPAPDIDFNRWQITGHYQYCSHTYQINSDLPDQGWLNDSYYNPTTTITTPTYLAFVNPQNYIAPDVLVNGPGITDLQLIQTIPPGDHDLLGGHHTCGTAKNFSIENDLFSSPDLSDFDSQIFTDAMMDEPLTGQLTGQHPRGYLIVNFDWTSASGLIDMGSAIPTITNTYYYNNPAPWTTTWTAAAYSIVGTTATAVFDLSQGFGGGDIPNTTTYHFKQFFNGSYLNFSVKGCCPANVPTGQMDITTSFSPRIDAACYSNIGGCNSTNNFCLTCNPITFNTNACIIELYKVSEIFNIHCPGCVTPGIQMNTCDVGRTNLNFSDYNDDGLPDNCNGADNCNLVKINTTEFTPPAPYYTPVCGSYPISHVNYANAIVGDTLSLVATGEAVYGLSHTSDAVCGFNYYDFTHAFQGWDFKDFYVEIGVPNADQVGLEGFDISLTWTHSGISCTIPLSGSNPQICNQIDVPANYCPVLLSDGTNLPVFLFKFSLSDFGAVGNCPWSFNDNDGYQFNAKFLVSENPLDNTTKNLTFNSYMYYTLHDINSCAPFESPGGSMQEGDIWQQCTGNCTNPPFYISCVSPTDPINFVRNQNALFYCDNRSGSATVLPIIATYNELWNDEDGGCDKTLNIEAGYQIVDNQSGSNLTNRFKYEYRLVPRIDANNGNWIFGPQLQSGTTPTFLLTVPIGYDAIFDSAYAEAPYWGGYNPMLSTGFDGTNVGSMQPVALGTGGNPAVIIGAGPLGLTCYVSTAGGIQPYVPPFLGDGILIPTGLPPYAHVQIPSTCNGFPDLLLGDEMFYEGVKFDFRPSCGSSLTSITTIPANYESATIPDYLNSVCPGDLPGADLPDDNSSIHVLNEPVASIGVTSLPTTYDPGFSNTELIITNNGDAVSGFEFYVLQSDFVNIPIPCISTQPGCQGTVLNRVGDATNLYYVYEFPGEIPANGTVTLYLSFPLNCGLQGASEDIALNYIWNCSGFQLNLGGTDICSADQVMDLSISFPDVDVPQPTYHIIGTEWCGPIYIQIILTSYEAGINNINFSIPAGQVPMNGQLVNNNPNYFGIQVLNSIQQPIFTADLTTVTQTLIGGQGYNLGIPYPYIDGLNGTPASYSSVIGPGGLSNGESVVITLEFQTSCQMENWNYINGFPFNFTYDDVYGCNQSTANGYINTITDNNGINEQGCVPRPLNLGQDCIGDLIFNWAGDNDAGAGILFRPVPGGGYTNGQSPPGSPFFHLINEEYEWSTTAVPPVSTNGQLYTVTVTEGTYCSASTLWTDAGQLQINPPVIVPPSCSNLNGGSITITSNWDPNGIPAYAWSNHQSGPQLINLTAGTYTVTATGIGFGGVTCTASATYTLEDVGLTVTGTVTNTACSTSNGGIAISVSGDPGPFTYSWNTVPTQTGSTAINLAAGGYIVTVTSSDNCTGTASFVVSNTGLSATTTFTNILCYGQSTGNATVTASGGTTPYTYFWNTVPVQTSATAINLAAGTYTVTVTDATGCSTGATVSITQPDTPISLSVSEVDVSCYSGADGSATVTANGGTSPYTYNWSSGSTIANPSSLTAGPYIVTVTDANLCTAAINVIVHQPQAALTVVASVINDESCSGAGDGSATASANGGNNLNYGYSWSNLAVTQRINGLSPGTYTVTVTELGIRCTTSASVTITGPSALSVSLSSTNVSCNGSPGQISVTVTGGTPGYSYSWNDGQTTATATNLPAGSYAVTVTDLDNCTATATATLTLPSSEMTATITAYNGTCSNFNSGSATVTATGGTSPYTYSWNTVPPQTSYVAANLSAQNYTVTVTDNVGCTATATITILQEGNVSITPDICNSSMITGFEIQGSCDAGYSYAWSSTLPANTVVDANNRLIPMAPGIYNVTVVVTDPTSQTFTVIDQFNVPNFNVTPQTVTGSVGLTYTLSQVQSAYIAWNLISYNTDVTYNPNGYPELYEKQVHFEGILKLDFIGGLYNEPGPQFELLSTNSHLTFGPGAMIDVPYYGIISVDGGVLEGCDYMWMGINLEDASPDPCTIPDIYNAEALLYGNPAFFGLEVNDAMYAVKYPAVSHMLVQNVSFDGNFIGLYEPEVNSCLVTDPYSLNSLTELGEITGNLFQCSYMLKHYFTGTLGTGPLLNCPYDQVAILNQNHRLPHALPAAITYPERESFAGIWVENLGWTGSIGGAFVIGSSDPNPQLRNKFQYMATGIGAVNSNVTVFNGTFQYLPNAAGTFLQNSEYDVSRFEQGNGIVSIGTPIAGVHYSSSLFLPGADRQLNNSFYQLAHSGIYSYKSQITADHMNMQNVLDGVDAVQHYYFGHKQVSITNSKIAASWVGVNINNGGEYYILDVSNNVFTIDYTGGSPINGAYGFGIKFHDMLMSLVGATPQMDANTFNMGQCSAGIYLNGALQINVEGNTLYMNDNNYNKYGIFTGAHNQITINQNNIYGNGFSTSNLYNNNPRSPFGVYANTQGAAVNTYLNCNHIQTTNTGVAFFGTTPNTYAEGNGLGYLNVGVRVPNGTTISQHIDRGLAYSTNNYWYNPASSGHDAENYNPGGIINPGQIFWTNAASAAYMTDLPPNIYPATAGWFQPRFNVDPTLNCQPSTYSFRSLHISDVFLDILDKIVALDSFDQGGSFAPAVKEAMQRHLLDKLVADTTLISVDTAYGSFIQRMQGSPVWQYRIIDSLIAQAELTPIGIQNVVDSFNYLLNSNNAYASILDSIIETFSSVILDSIASPNVRSVLFQLDSTNEVSKNYMMTIMSMEDSAFQLKKMQLDNIIILNQNATDTSPFENYRKTVNDIYLRTLAKGIDSFSTTDSVNLDMIANLCPLAGGLAVFDARSMYDLIEPALYPDEELCTTAHYDIYRIPHTDSSLSALPAEIVKLYPNPANDKLILDWRTMDPENAILIITSMLGQGMINQKVISSTGLQQIDISRLAPGTYVARLTNAHVQFFQTKVVVIR